MKIKAWFKKLLYESFIFYIVISWLMFNIAIAAVVIDYLIQTLPDRQYLILVVYTGLAIGWFTFMIYNLYLKSTKFKGANK